MEAYASFLAYLLRIAPGLGLAFALFVLIPRKQQLLRIGIYLAAFALVRDAMVLGGLWQLGEQWPVWIRFVRPDFLLPMMLGTLFFVGLSLWAERGELAARVVWFRKARISAIGWGLTAGVAVALPVFLQDLGTPLSARGGAVADDALFIILLFSMIGNLLEELLFRGYLQGWLNTQLSPTRSVLISGLGFGFAHVFLGATVTSAGWPILLFTCYEGLICAFLAQRHGLAAAAVAHGLGIFLVASGLI